MALSRTRLLCHLQRTIQCFQSRRKMQILRLPLPLHLQMQALVSQPLLPLLIQPLSLHQRRIQPEKLYMLRWSSATTTLVMLTMV